MTSFHSLQKNKVSKPKQNRQRRKDEYSTSDVPSSSDDESSSSKV
jgi:hypothetical protein